MTCSPPDIMAPWGKTGDGGAWHPLVHHGVDAAAVAEVLWWKMLVPSLRQRVAVGLGMDVHGALRWVRLLAWLHDVGKLTAPFQRLDDVQAQRLRALGWDLRGGRLVAHGAVSALVIEESLEGRGSRFDRKALAAAAGGHHGSFVDAEDPADRLSDQRSSFAELAIARSGPLPALGNVNNVALGAVAGLMTLSDWIASNAAWFPPSCRPNASPDLHGLVAYEHLAAHRAAQAWEALAWSAPQARSSADPLRAMFPFITTPSPMQRAALEVADALDVPALCVIEDRTGSGKTEAALLLAASFIRSGNVRGTFVGLPTRATADQAYRRVVHAFAGATAQGERVRVELVHAFASLTPAYRELIDEPRVRDVARDQDRSGSASEQVVAGGWFSPRKRGLLAPIAVGTVDQAMLAALPSRHCTLRLLGLAGKTVVLDEVHAYDVYMSGVVERLLEWLAALGCPVVLLSATLPTKAREALIAAYARGGGLEASATGDPGSYPRLNVLSASGRRERSVPSEVERVTRVELVEEDQDRIVSEVVALADAGLEVALIANTVARSRRWYRLLKGRAGERMPVDLLHARFRLVERAGIEERIVHRYARDGKRPGGSIVVATQVLEQSLDLDFDLVVSELAPVDLLLQRAGRSHRHLRARPAVAGDGPWLRVVVPAADDDGLPQFGRGGAARVYAEHRLLRSFVALREHLGGARGVVVERGDRSDVDALVQRVYGEDDLGVRTARWDATRRAMHEDETKQREYARTRTLTDPGSEHLITDRLGEAFDEEDPSAPLPPTTRLGDDPVRLLLLDPAERSELERRGLDGSDRLPAPVVTWLQMRTASLPPWPFRSADLVRERDERLARQAPALAWLHRVELDAERRGTLAGVPIASDPILGVLVGAETEESTA